MYGNRIVKIGRGDRKGEVREGYVCKNGRGGMTESGTVVVRKGTDCKGKERKG